MAHSDVSERCLQVWIKRFNQAGIDGVTYRPKSGQPRLMDAEAIAEKILPVVDNPKLTELLEDEGVEVFLAFLNTMAKETQNQKQESRRVCLVLDNASWHKPRNRNEFEQEETEVTKVQSFVSEMVTHFVSPSE